MSVIHSPQEPSLNGRLASFLLAVFIALVIFLLRFWYLQVVLSDDLTEKAASIRLVEVPHLAPRGLIFDRKNRPVATIASKFVVTAVPSEVAKNPWVIEKIANLVAADPKKLREKVEAGLWRRHFPTPIFVGTDVTVATKIAEAGEFLPGIGVDTLPMRSYPETKLLAHILGYVWVPSDKDLDRIEKEGITDPADYVGKSGLERTYEAQLMGSEGSEKYEVDVKRRPQRVNARKAPIPGSKLILSLDLDLQAKALAMLAGRKGAVVALDPTNGEVLCLVSAPTYDTSVFEGGISSTDWATLRDDPTFPMLNRAIRSSYSPGSTFKIVTTIASLLAGQFSASKTVYCAGGYKIGNRTMKCMGHHGAITFDRAFRKSCNTYFATIGYNAGIEKLREAAKVCGLGAPTGIDLPFEGKGLVPTQEWLDSIKEPRKWYPGDTVNVTIGQGMLETTPLQMASLVSLLANRGHSYVPHLVKAVQNPLSDDSIQQIEPKTLSQIDAPAELWSGLMEAMVGVIDDGTAGSARISGLRWGGKTGSTEHRRGAKTHAWFVGIAPIDNPKIAIAVLVEEAGHGGDIAAPVAKAIVEAYLKKPVTSAKPKLNLTASSRANDLSPSDPNSSSNRQASSPDSNAVRASESPSPANR